MRAIRQKRSCLSRLYSEEKTLFDRINRIDRMNAQILIKQCQSLFGDPTPCPSIILFIPLILSNLRLGRIHQRHGYG
jgi:hypothetical protein